MKYARKQIGDKVIYYLDGVKKYETDSYPEGEIVSWREFAKNGVLIKESYKSAFDDERWQKSFDEKGNLKSHEGVSGNGESYSLHYNYDDLGRMISEIEVEHNYSSRIEYGNGGKVEYTGTLTDDEENIIEYDRNENVTHRKFTDGREDWQEYDKNGNKVHYKNSDGSEWWKQYDENKIEVYRKDSDGVEWWSGDNPDNPKYAAVEIEEKDFPGLFI